LQLLLVAVVHQPAAHGDGLTFVPAELVDVNGGGLDTLGGLHVGLLLVLPLMIAQAVKGRQPGYSNETNRLRRFVSFEYGKPSLTNIHPACKALGCAAREAALQWSQNGRGSETGDQE